MPVTDTDAVERFRRGDEQAFASIYRDVRPLVLALARQSLHNASDAEDVLQQVLLSAWQGRHGYRPERSELSTWLMGIARHKIADAHAARARRQRIRARVESTSPPIDGQHADDRRTDDLVLSLAVQEEIGRLEEHRRQVLSLVLFDDLSQSQIADRLGIPLGTVKSHIRRSVQLLRRRRASVPVGTEATVSVPGRVRGVPHAGSTAGRRPCPQ